MTQLVARADRSSYKRACRCRSVGGGVRYLGGGAAGACGQPQRWHRRQRRDRVDALGGVGLEPRTLRGVDHLLVASHRHVHVLTLPDGGRRQILAVPDALYLNALCVHEGRVFACDSIGHRVHVLELRDDCS